MCLHLAGGLAISVKPRSWIKEEQTSVSVTNSSATELAGWKYILISKGHWVTPSSLCSGLTEVPTGIPEDTVHIDLSNNAIRHLRARDFKTARSLISLNLSHNNMEHIDTGKTLYVCYYCCISDQWILWNMLNIFRNIQDENLYM